MKLIFNNNIFCILLFSLNIKSEEIYFDLSENNIEIKTDFNGREIIIFGLLKEGHDTLLTIKGPPSKMRIQKKIIFRCMGQQ